MSADGRFVRFDLMSSDPARSQAFYGALLGWQFAVEALGGFQVTTILLDDHPLGWVVPFNVAGYPAHWMAYVAVADVDAACAQVTALGGMVCVPPESLPGCRFAVVEDATGALFSPVSGLDAAPSPAPVGGPCWVQLLTRDASASLAFYRDLLAWEHTTMETLGQPPFYLFLNEAVAFASMMEKPAEAPTSERDAWLPYFRVADVTERTTAAATLGAQVFVSPTFMPGMGGFAVLADPTGAMFALWEDAPAAATRAG